MADRSVRGLVAQSMNGSRGLVAPKLGALPVNATSGSGSITVRRPCYALIIARGPGGSGGGGSGPTVCSGGGGGAVLYKRVLLRAGQTISYTVGTPGAAPTFSSVPGNDGTDSTVTLPDGTVLRAGGGKRGLFGDGVAGGAGGLATGGDINRNGGAGGSAASGTNGEPGSPGQGNGAGAGGAKLSNSGGGGGAAGLTEILSDLVGGNGSDAGSGVAPIGIGGGSGGGRDGSSSTVGGDGQVLIMFAAMPK